MFLPSTVLVVAQTNWCIKNHSPTMNNESYFPAKMMYTYIDIVQALLPGYLGSAMECQTPAASAAKHTLLPSLPSAESSRPVVARHPRTKIQWQRRCGPHMRVYHSPTAYGCDEVINMFYSRGMLRSTDLPAPCSASLGSLSSEANIAF